MPYKKQAEFSVTKQDRSKKTLDDLLEAAYEIVGQADPSLFTSRELSKKSGYALGTLVKRLNSVENVFLWVIKYGQKKHLETATTLISEFDPHLPVEIFVENIVNLLFKTIPKVNPSVIRYYESRATKKNVVNENFYNILDFLVDPYLAMLKKNTSNTFRQVSNDEAKFILRSFLIFAERPFVDDDPIAGTPLHRKIVVENITRLLGK
jgi:hypothetical protein